MTKKARMADVIQKSVESIPQVTEEDRKRAWLETWTRVLGESKTELSAAASELPSDVAYEFIQAALRMIRHNQLPPAVMATVRSALREVHSCLFRRVVRYLVSHDAHEHAEAMLAQGPVVHTMTFSSEAKPHEVTLPWAQSKRKVSRGRRSPKPRARGRKARSAGT